MVDILTIGIPGPSGPAVVSAGAIITARGDQIVGNASNVAARVAIGTSGKYWRSNGTDPSWTVIAAADLPSTIDAAKLADGSVSNAELQFIGTLTSDAQTQINGKAALSHGHLVAADRGVYIDNAAQSTADTDNTSSTSTWATAMDYSLVLPTGTWTIWMVGGISLKHSASGVSEGRVTIDGQDSTERLTGALSSTLWIPVMDNDSKTGCTGTVHMRVQFRTNASFAGTTNARNPWMQAVCARTA